MKQVTNRTPTYSTGVSAALHALSRRKARSRNLVGIRKRWKAVVYKAKFDYSCRRVRLRPLGESVNERDDRGPS